MRKLLKSFHLVEDGLLVGILFLMILLSVVEIVLRNFFAISLTWIDPILRNGVLWIALLGTMVASRNDQQIRIDVASHYLPAHIKRGLSVLLDLVTAGVCLAVAGYSVSYVFIDTMVYGGNAFGRVPAWALQIIIPIGFLSIGLRYFLLFVLNLLGRRPDFSDDNNGKEPTQ